MIDHLTLQNWQSIAAIIAAVFALFALILNAIQLKRNTDFAKQAATKTTYREYLKLACEYPHFGDGNRRFDDEMEQSRYEWFVSFFLLAAEEVLQYASKDFQWIEAVKEEIGRHTEYLTSYYFQHTEIHFYGDELQRVIRQVIDEHGGKVEP